MKKCALRNKWLLRVDFFNLRRFFMEILPFSDTRYGRLLWVPIAALAVLVLADPALAAETGSEFSELWTLLSGWCSGFLGKSLAIAFLLVGLAMGVVRGSIVAAAACVGAAVCLLMAPGIIDSMFATGG